MNSKIIFGIAGLVVTGMVYGSKTEPIQSDLDGDAGTGSAAAGRAAWIQEHRPSSGIDARSCAGCHGTDLRLPGRHVKTGKPIEPIALSVNPNRLKDPKKLEKWFRRNCRWTLGRECTPREKSDFIHFITSQ